MARIKAWTALNDNPAVTARRLDSAECCTPVNKETTALLNLVVFSFAMPQLKGIKKFDDRIGVWGFWKYFMVIKDVFYGLNVPPMALKR